MQGSQRCAQMSFFDGWIWRIGGKAFLAIIPGPGSKISCHFDHPKMGDISWKKTGGRSVMITGVPYIYLFCTWTTTDVRMKCT